MQLCCVNFEYLRWSLKSSTRIISVIKYSGLRFNTLQLKMYERFSLDSLWETRFYVMLRIHKSTIFERTCNGCHINVFLAILDQLIILSSIFGCTHIEFSHHILLNWFLIALSIMIYRFSKWEIHHMSHCHFASQKFNHLGDERNW